MSTFDQRNRDFCKALTDMQFAYVDDEAENANLLERMELLTTSLRNDYGIDASWDGLRRLWTIELTEDGCLMRDRACKAEAENAKLRELVQDLHKALFTLDIDHCQACPRDNINGPCTKFMVCGSDECSIEEEMSELGIEV